MLRRWSRQVIVALALDRLSALLVGGIGRRRLLDRQAISLPTLTNSWETTLPALEELFSESAWRGHRLHIVLSNHYVHYQALARSKGLTSGEMLKLAAVQFADTYGELAADWDIRISPPSRDGSTLACGVPSGLLAALRSSCEKKARLVSVRPALMPFFNRIRPMIGRSAGYMALIENGRLSIAVLEDGHWLSVSSRAGGHARLPQMLLEESELHQRLPGGLIWVCDLTGKAKLPTDPAWSSRLITPPGIPGLASQPDLANWGLA